MKSSEPRHFPFDVFLSHSSKDKPLVRLLAVKMRDQEGFRAWYDEWNLQPGLPWQEALEQGLAESASIAVFIGPEKLGPWHNEELREAINRSVSSNDGFRVIPVLLPGADPDTLPTFLKRMMWVDFRSGGDDAIAWKKLTAAIRGEAFEEAAFSLSEEVKPYRGFAPFETEDAPYFFGREEEVDNLLDLVKAKNSTLLIGGSGFGKTSLVQAGLVPRLKADAVTDKWEVCTMRPGSDPLQNLANLVMGLNSTITDPLEILDKASALKNRMRTAPDALRNGITLFFNTRQRPVLVVVDQLEDLFHLDNDQQTIESFAANLADTAFKADGSIRLLLVCRSDFATELTPFPNLAKLCPSDARLELEEATQEDILKFVQQSAFVAGVFFEKGLVNTLVKEVGDQACKLSWIQIELEKLWEKRKGAWLTVDAFEKTGGITVSLRERAEKYLSGMPGEGFDNAHRMLLMRAIDPGEGVPDRRISASFDSLITRTNPKPTVRSLVMRLTGPEFRLAEAKGNEIIICNDYLVTEWQPIRDFLNKNRGAFRTLHRIHRSSEEWLKRDRNREFLFKGALLASFEDLEKRGADGGLTREQLPEKENHYINTSIKERVRKKRLRQGIMAVISTLLLFALVGLIVAITFYNVAKTEKVNAEHSAEVAIAARDTAEKAQEVALIEKHRAESEKLRAESEKQKAERAGEVAVIQRDLAVSAQRLAVLKQMEADSSKKVAVFQKDMADSLKELAIEDKKKIEDSKKQIEKDYRRSIAQTKALLAEELLLEEGKGRDALFISYLAFNINDTSQGSPLDQRIYDAMHAARQNNSPTQPISMGAAARQVTYLPNGSLVSGGDDGLIRFHQSALGSSEYNSLGNVRGMAASGDGRYLVAGNLKGQVRYWDLKGNSPEGKLVFNGESRIVELAFGGNLLAAANENTIRIFDIGGAGFSAVQTVQAGLGEKFTCLDFHKNGLLVAGTEKGGQAYLRSWKLRANQNLEDLGTSPSTSGQITAVSINPNGSKIALGTREGALLVGSISASGPSITKILARQKRKVTSLAFHPSLNRLASGSMDKSVRITDLDNPKMFILLTTPTHWIWSISFDPSGKNIAAATEDGKIFILPASGKAMYNKRCQFDLGAEEQTKLFKKYFPKDIDFKPWSCP